MKTTSPKFRWEEVERLLRGFCWAVNREDLPKVHCNKLKRIARSVIVGVIGRVERRSLAPSVAKINVSLPHGL